MCKSRFKNTGTNATRKCFERPNVLQKIYFGLPHKQSKTSSVGQRTSITGITAIRVFCTGESKFELFGKRRHYIQIKVGEHVNNNCLNYMVKHGSHVTIWGSFGGGKVGDLVKITLTIEKNYITVL